MNIDNIASSIAASVTNDDDAALYGIDPALIAIILQIFAQLWPLIQDCRKRDEDDVEAVVRLSRERVPGWRVRQWRLSRTVRAEMGEDADKSLVRDICREITNAAGDPETAKAICEGLR